MHLYTYARPASLTRVIHISETVMHISASLTYIYMYIYTWGVGLEWGVCPTVVAWCSIRRNSRIPPACCRVTCKQTQAQSRECQQVSIRKCGHYKSLTGRAQQQ